MWKIGKKKYLAVDWNVGDLGCSATPKWIWAFGLSTWPQTDSLSEMGPCWSCPHTLASIGPERRKMVYWLLLFHVCIASDVDPNHTKARASLPCSVYGISIGPTQLTVWIGVIRSVWAKHEQTLGLSEWVGGALSGTTQFRPRPNCGLFSLVLLIVINKKDHNKF
jgi:hypothetical protein